MAYKVRLDKKASKFYSAADKGLKKKLNRCFEVLKQTPRKHPNIKTLQGKFSGQYRYRVGNYRVIYKIREDVVEVIVLVIGHRSDTYK